MPEPHERPECFCGERGTCPLHEMDFRYEIVRNPEPDQPSDLFFVTVHETRDGEDTGVVLERFSTDDPYRDVEAARYAQAVPLEQRWAEDAERERGERWP